jgi:hypothetical protein
VDTELSLSKLAVYLGCEESKSRSRCLSKRGIPRNDIDVHVQPDLTADDLIAIGVAQSGT